MINSASNSELFLSIMSRLNMLIIEMLVVNKSISGEELLAFIDQQTAGAQDKNVPGGNNLSDEQIKFVTEQFGMIRQMIQNAIANRR